MPNATMSFDSATETLRKMVSKREAKALINAALELADDPRSASDLAIEFGVPASIVAAIQAP